MMDEKNNNKNVFIGIVIFIIIAILGFFIYFMFIKGDGDSSNNNQQGTDNGNSKYEDNKKYDIINFDEYIISCRKLKGLKDLDYDFYDNQESKKLNNGNISITISNDKTVKIVNGNNNISIKNISNAKSIYMLDNDNYVYIITVDGMVYKYNISDNDGMAIKLVNIKNAQQFVYITMSFDTGESKWYMGIVDDSINYIKIRGQ